MKRIELLAPAKNLATARAAIDSGADAVYMGGPSLGARAAATNSLEEVRQAADYAHLFGARLYMTLNTIVYEHELAEARSIAQAALDAGVDARSRDPFRRTGHRNTGHADNGPDGWLLHPLHRSDQCPLRDAREAARYQAPNDPGGG